MPHDSDDDGASSKKRSNKELKKRIEGFGNAPMPPAESATDRLWGRLNEDQTLMGWYNTARDSVNQVLDAVDDTVNAIADAVDDTIAAVIGDEDEESLEGPAPATNRRQGEGHRRAANDSDDEPPADAVKRDNNNQRRKVVDSGERSGTDWPQVVTDICVEGDLEEFVLMVRSQLKNDFEEQEFGDALADQLLNEVKADATLRVLHVMQAVVTDDNLEHATERIRSRCDKKLSKLQGQACFAKIAKEVQGEPKKGAPASTAGEAKAAPAAPPVDLLDMGSPAATQATNGASSAPSSASTAPKVKAKAQEPDDLIGLGASPAAAAPVTALPPPSGAVVAPVTTAFKRGDRVRALWAGDGKRYPAVVETHRGQTVTVQWLRRHAAASASEAFVADVGDDSTHETVPASEVQFVSAAPAPRTAAASGLGDLLDFDAPAPAQAAASAVATTTPAPASSAAPSTMTGLDLGAGLSTTTSAPSSAPAAASFNANFAAFGSAPAGWQSGVSAPTSAAQAWPPAQVAKASMGAPTGFGAPLGAAGGIRPPMGSGPALGGYGAGGGYAALGAPGTLAGGAVLGSGTVPPKAAAQKAAPPAKKDIEVGDAFQLTFGGK